MATDLLFTTVLSVSVRLAAYLSGLITSNDGKFSPNEEKIKQ